MARRAAWENTKKTKGFYVRGYRGTATALLVSLIFNLWLGLGVFYFYFKLPEPDFYATSGVVPPIKLTALSAPNMSSTPLLPEDKDIPA